MWQMSMAIDGKQSAGYILITCCENKECVALLVQVEALAEGKRATVNTVRVSEVIFHSKYYTKQWIIMLFKYSSNMILNRGFWASIF